MGQAGTRPRQPADQRYDNAYLFGAICPARGVGAALALPYADADMMQLHLDEISRHVADGAHAVLLLDRAGWHTTGKLATKNGTSMQRGPDCLSGLLATAEMSASTRSPVARLRQAGPRRHHFHP